MIMFVFAHMHMHAHAHVHVHACHPHQALRNPLLVNVANLISLAATAGHDAWPTSMSAPLATLHTHTHAGGRSQTVQSLAVEPLEPRLRRRTCITSASSSAAPT